jgi:hypothetical protein
MARGKNTFLTIMIKSTLLEPPMTHPPHKRKSPTIPSLLKWANSNDVDQYAKAINQQNNVNLSSKRLKRMQ